VTKAAVSEPQFIQLFESLGAAGVARHIGVNERQVHSRRRSIEKRLGISLIPPNMPPDQWSMLVRKHRARIDVAMTDGTVIIFSDPHYWPGVKTTAHRAVLKFCQELKPKIVVCNGDAFDGSRVSRHPKIGFLEKSPTVIEEIKAVQERLREVEQAAPKATLVWPLGNHDLRFEAKLAASAPEFEGVHGMHLKDHFSDRWQPCWGLHLNPGTHSYTVVKHRWHNGIHAVWNNTLKSGCSMVTGHLHSLKVLPYSDYGPFPRFGVDAGTTSEPYDEQFTAYTEDNPVNWRSGFVILTYHKGRLMWPELVHKWDEDHVEFRGQLIKV